jgi:uncharacterized protein (TIGR03083 family)
MTTTSTTDVADIPELGHAEAMALQAAEFERDLDMLRGLSDEQWSSPTACPDWDVRHMWLHVLGASEAGASMRENLHQMRLARKRVKGAGEVLEAALSAVQITERAHLGPEELVDRLTQIAPRAVAGRRRTPAPIRAVKIAVDAPVVEKWSLGYLIDTIYLRDAWMHRIDTSRATGADLVLTHEHDGRIVADVVAEWARRHGQPFRLELSGPAGGEFHAGSAGQEIGIDAIEFCCLLAGRGDATGLLATIVPF